jgi:hypothetical protein
MRKLLILLLVATVLALLPAMVAGLAWGFESDVFVPFAWLGLIAAALISIRRQVAGAALGLVSAGLLWWELADGIGLFLLFEPNNSPLYGVLLLPWLLALACITLSAKVLILIKFERTMAPISSTALLAFLIAFVPASFASREYLRNGFAEFQMGQNGGPMIMTFKSSPGELRIFRVPITSAEIIDHVRNEADSFGPVLCIVNTRLVARYNFDTLKEVTLVGLENWRVPHPPSWSANEMEGDVSFLRPHP